MQPVSSFEEVGCFVWGNTMFKREPPFARNLQWTTALKPASLKHKQN
jgi:hypothetical protein